MSQTPTPEQTIAYLRTEAEDLRASRDRCLDKLTKWAIEAEAVNDLCNGLSPMPLGTPMRERVAQVIAFGRGLDRWRLENLGKWGKMIQCGLSVDQPELLICIDDALERIPKLQNALAFMLNNVGNPVSLETRDRFQEAQELVPTAMRQDPRNARVGDTLRMAPHRISITDRDRTATVDGQEETFRAFRCETCGHDWLSNNPNVKFCPSCGVRFASVEDVSV